MGLAGQAALEGQWTERNQHWLRPAASKEWIGLWAGGWKTGEQMSSVADPVARSSGFGAPWAQRVEPGA